MSIKIPAGIELILKGNTNQVIFDGCRSSVSAWGSADVGAGGRGGVKAESHHDTKLA